MPRLYGPRLYLASERATYIRRQLLGLGGEVLFVCGVRNNKMFLHEPRSSLLTLHKPSAIRGGRTTSILCSDEG